MILIDVLVLLLDAAYSADFRVHKDAMHLYR